MHVTWPLEVVSREVTRCACDVAARGGQQWSWYRSPLEIEDAWHWTLRKGRTPPASQHRVWVPHIHGDLAEIVSVCLSVCVCHSQCLDLSRLLILSTTVSPACCSSCRTLLMLRSATLTPLMETRQSPTRSAPVLMAAKDTGDTHTCAHTHTHTHTTPHTHLAAAPSRLISEITTFLPGCSDPFSRSPHFSPGWRVSSTV